MKNGDVSERKVLVALENSPYSNTILKYICNLFVGQPAIKFHLIGIVPCHVSELSRNWLSQEELLSAIDNATRKKYAAYKIFLAEKMRDLISCGFTENQVGTSVLLAKGGTVGDILYQAQKEKYDALVLGKKDLSRLEKMFLGSVSTEVLKRKSLLPVWIVSGTVSSQRFLVPVDCTPHTLEAVNHLAFMLKDNPAVEITLFHSCALLASDHITPKESFYGKWGKEWCDEHLKGEEDDHFHFHATEQVLKEAGFPMERVRRLETREGIEPGQMIVHHIKHEDYGTIVMGRRGKDVSKGIFRGVSDRVLANVENVAIWIIG